MDADGTGTISLQEFEKHLDDARVVAYFNTLKLDVSDAATLFGLLDYDQSGSVDIQEFVMIAALLKHKCSNSPPTGVKHEGLNMPLCKESIKVAL